MKKGDKVWKVYNNGSLGGFGLGKENDNENPNPVIIHKVVGKNFFTADGRRFPICNAFLSREEAVQFAIQENKKLIKKIQKQIVSLESSLSK